jgi:hypothetical protein
MGSLLPSAVGAVNPQELAAPNSATELLRKHGIPLLTNHPDRCQHADHTHELIEPAGFRPVALEGDTLCGVESVTG